MARTSKYIGASKQYKYVYKYLGENGKYVWEARVDGVSRMKPDEREAAKTADILLVKAGKQPVNVLTKKN